MRIPIRFLGTLTVALAIAIAPRPSDAALITAEAALSTSTLIDFSAFGGPFLETSGPVQIGTPVGRDIEWTSTFCCSVIGNSGYVLDFNTLWTTARNGYTGLNTGQATMLFTFQDAPVAGVGGFINYAPATGGGLNVILAALDQNGGVLESYDISVLAPVAQGVNDDGAFRGILRPTADIWALAISNQFVVLDDFRFTDVAQPVPEPGSLILFGTGVCGLLARARRRNRAEV